MPTTWFVSRHPGAHDWMRAQSERGALGFHVDRYVQHLDPATPAPGDVVVGTLPFIDVLRLRERKVRFLALALDLPEDVRGRELSAGEMAGYGARLLDVDLQLREDTLLAPPGRLAASPGKDLPELRLAFVSDQLTPLYLAARQHAERIRHMVLFATPKMTGKAAILERTLDGFGTMPFDVECIRLGQDGEDFPALLHAVRDHAIAAWQRFPGTRLVADLTGGTKTMSLALATLVAERVQQGQSAGSVYTNTDAGIFQWVQPPGPTDDIRYSMGLDEALAVQNLRIDSIASDSEGWSARARAREPLTHAVMGVERQGFIGALNQWASIARSLGGESDAGYPIRIGSGSYKIQDRPVELRALKSPDAAVIDGAEAAGLIDSIQPGNWKEQKQIESMRFCSVDAARYLGGCWLEEWIWLQLASLSSAPQKLAVGVNVSDATEATVANEFDAILVHRNRLLVIEAKTANLGHGRASQPLYELDSKGSRLAQLHGARLLVSFRSLDQPTLARAAERKVSLVARGVKPLKHDLALQGQTPRNVHSLNALSRLVANWIETGDLELDGIRTPFNDPSKVTAPARQVHQGGYQPGNAARGNPRKHHHANRKGGKHIRRSSR